MEDPADARTEDKLRESIRLIEENRDAYGDRVDEWRDEVDGLREKLPRLGELLAAAQRELDAATDQWGIDFYADAVNYYTHTAPTYWPKRIAQLDRDIAAGDAILLTLDERLAAERAALGRLLNPPVRQCLEWAETHPAADWYERVSRADLAGKARLLVDPLCAARNH